MEQEGVDMQEVLSSKEKMTIIARLIVNCMSHEEIDMFCVALLHANMMCVHQPKGE